ncbi:uncharacterized protein [Onthophagus taurus]|uniref:uncharacterized protein n=1 Tax=Onthophagus taurus TaxID=166361 RepID=UPI000C1FEE98|nr:uncharacterized protein LOC111414932 [Onthophagus taurus]
MAPLLTCTANSLCHVDYGIPVSVYKSTDYRTSTDTSHHFMPPLPQDFDCRVKAKFNPIFPNECKRNDIQFKTIYNQEYYTKQANTSQNMTRATERDKVLYLRNIQERMFAAPPPPLGTPTTTTKQDYCGSFSPPTYRQVFPPNPYAYCPIKALGRDESKPIPPELPGVYRHMDPYMTTARMSYIPFTINQQNGIARKDIVTYYDANNIPRAGKGYGPRNGPPIEPSYQSPNFNMIDKVTFKTKHQGKFIPRGLKKLPNAGKSEYGSNYTFQTYYDSYPFIMTPLVDWTDSLPKSSIWQDLSPPGMYCTEYCHIGKGWPVRAVVDPNLPVESRFRDPDLCKDIDNPMQIVCVDA